MKRFTCYTLLAALLALSGVAFAAPDHDIQAAQAAHGAALGAGRFDGVIRKIDKRAKLITIEHGDKMVLAFKATNPKLLTVAKVGDPIRFDADIQRGQFLVTHIEAKP